jgi:hypothetical protein
LTVPFNGLSLSKVAADLAAHAVNGWPPEVINDFGNLGFVRPAGIVFLSNLFAWMSAHQTKITLTNLRGKRRQVSGRLPVLRAALRRKASPGCITTVDNATTDEDRSSAIAMAGWNTTLFLGWLRACRSLPRAACTTGR